MKFGTKEVIGAKQPNLARFKELIKSPDIRW